MTNYFGVWFNKWSLFSGFFKMYFFIHFGSSPYTMMIKIYETMYLEREKRLKSLVLSVLWVKGVGYPPLWYTLVLWIWGFPYLLIVTPFGWVMVLDILLGRSTLIYWLAMFLFSCTLLLFCFVSYNIVIVHRNC